MKYLLSMLFLVGVLANVNAQKRNAVYVEALGNGLFYSINYERQILNNRNLGIKIGAMYFKGSSHVVMLPLHLRYVLGQKHGLEIAGGITYQYRFSNSENEGILAPSGALMYRYQADNNFLFRVGIAPTFVKYEDNAYFSSAFLYVWPGASIGYTF